MVNQSTAYAEADCELHVIRGDDGILCGIIAIDSTVLGPAAGGCRLWRYSTPSDVVDDAIRLARGMTYKNALAGLPFGGGKAVLMRPTGDFDRSRLMQLVGQTVGDLNGRYVIAEDVGTTVADMDVIARSTRHVAGREAAPGKAGGDPSTWTALGVFESMQRATKLLFGKSLADVTVAVQGVGGVGSALCRHLREAGAKLIIADIDALRARAVARDLDAVSVDCRDVLSVDADIVSPCALGAVLNAETLPTIAARLVCGAANNQLATAADGHALAARGIAYAPDYLVNAGGIISVVSEYLDGSIREVDRQVRQISTRLVDVLEVAMTTGATPEDVADDRARTIVADAWRQAA